MIFLSMKFVSTPSILNRKDGINKNAPEGSLALWMVKNEG
jgi:hypothetical protein